MNKFIILIGVLLLFSSCQETKKVFIASHLADCEGVAPHKCMLYKEAIIDEWTYFYDTIEGFEYEEGYSYTLEVTVTKIENPLADGSSLHYALIKVLSKEKDSSIAQNISVKTQEFKKNMISVEYQAASRGSFMHIKISKDFIEKTNDRNLKNVKSKECSKEDWSSIVSFTKTISVDKIHELQSPTEKRLYDGAAHALLKINMGNTVYTSNGFDHGSPPEEIKQLVTSILSLSESIE